MLLDLWLWRKQRVNGGAVPHTRWKTAEEVKAERIALGIIPADVAAVVNKVARKAIKTATVKNVADVMEWAGQDDQRLLYERQIRLAIARRNQEWQDEYTRLFDMAVMEFMQAEEEAIVLLMFEL